MDKRKHIKKTLTATEFAAVRHLLKISDDRISAAYAVMVNNETRISVAARYVVSPQAVALSVDLVWGTFNAYTAAKAAEGKNGK